LADASIAFFVFLSTIFHADSGKEEGWGHSEDVCLMFSEWSPLIILYLH